MHSAGDKPAASFDEIDQGLRLAGSMLSMFA